MDEDVRGTDAVEPDVRRMPVTGECRSQLELSRLTFRSLGGVEVTGYSIGGRTMKRGRSSCTAMVSARGATSNGIGRKQDSTS